MPARGREAIKSEEGSFGSPKPDFYKMSGPKYITVFIPQNCYQNYNPAPSTIHLVYMEKRFLI
jgi:hypothetical protein